MDKVLSSYLDQVDRRLRPLPAAERADIVQEIRSEMLELEAGGLTPEQILSELGLDKDASASDILRAIAGRPLESDPVAGRLAALYLGAVIAGSTTGPLDLDAALDGLRQLLEKVAGGAAPDEAIEALTAGEFTSFSDFQSRFTGGTAPGLDTFLVNLLLSGGDISILFSSVICWVLIALCVFGILSPIMMNRMEKNAVKQAGGDIPGETGDDPVRTSD